jgi:hypothetical protein
MMTAAAAFLAHCLNDLAAGSAADPGADQG